MTKDELIEIIEDCVVESTMSNFGEEVCYKTLIKELNEKIPEQLSIAVVVVSEADLCQYDKMCVRRKINDGCPYDCKDDTRKMNN